MSDPFGSAVQWIKGSSRTDVSADNPLPVAIVSGTVTTGEGGVAETVTVSQSALPTGASTAQGQSDTISVLNQMYALLGSGIDVQFDNTLAVSAQSLPLPTGAADQETQEDILNAIQGPLSVNVNGTVPVSLADKSVTVSGPVEISNDSLAITAASPLPVSGSVSLDDQPVEVFGTVGVSGSTAPIAVTDGGQSLTVDGSIAVSGVSGTVSITPASTTLPVSDGNGSLTVDGTVGVNNFPAAQAVTQSGTWNVTTWPGAGTTSTALNAYRNVALNATPVQIKSGISRLHSYSVYNSGSVMTYFQVWNALAANVTPGTTVPFLTVGIPAGSMWDGSFPISMNFTNGITIAATLNSDGSGGNPAVALGVGFLGYI